MPAPDELAYTGGWRRDGLILRPTGLTAQQRFGDAIADAIAASRLEQEAS